MLNRNPNRKDSEVRQECRLFVIGLAILACVALPVRFGSNSFSQQRTDCEKCFMTKDDLATMFSGPKMVGFSQFSENGIIEKEPVPKTQHSSFRNDSVGTDAADIPEGGGSFDIVVRKDVSQLDEKTGRRLGFGLRSTEWSSLFFQVLGCPPAEPYVASEDIDAWTENRKASFQATIPEYPLLARMWDPFRNIWYSPDEIAALKVECQAVSQRYSNTSLSSSALQKIEAACDEALKDGLALFLVGD